MVLLKIPCSSQREYECKELFFIIFARLISQEAAGNTQAIHLIDRKNKENSPF